VRFGFWPGPTQPVDEVLALARHAEQKGWDGIWFADHFMPNLGDVGMPWAECWTTLAALAASVPRVRIGPLVTGNTYRHPAVLAKMAATVDRISGGRLVLGLGAGWQENEHRAYGIPFYTVAERLRRLEEACQVIRGLFAEPRASFEGKHYALSDAPLEPKPVQRPLPLLIGGGGEKVTLRIAARFANEWNTWGDVETLRRKMKIMDGYCAEVGRDPSQIQRSACTLLFLTDDAKAAEGARKRSPMPMLAGDVETVRETVRAYAQAGVDELIFPDFNLGSPEQKRAFLDRFMSEIAPAVR
jgi:F420-dependent oxidoreductase-like protein